MANDDFCTRLKDLRGKLSQEDLAAATGETRAIIRNWELGKSEIKHPALIKLCDYFNVSADYLIGRTDAKTDNKDVQFICDYTGISSEAVEAFRELPLWHEENALPLIDDFLSIEMPFFAGHLLRIKKAVSVAEEAIKNTDSETVQPPIARFDRLTETKRELELSLFSFSEYCRQMLNRLFGAYDTLSRFDDAFEVWLRSNATEERYSEKEVPVDGKET